MSIKRMFAAMVSSLLLFSVQGVTALAEVALPDGAVKGLPERLAALDNEGNAVNSETGEYFFHVENMQYGETYYKEVQLMNLRDDASYYIYFYVEPLYKAGEIDLEKGCECVFLLDGQEFYRGDVNGQGNFDLSDTYYVCGFFEPGDAHTLRAEVTWNDLDVIGNVDNGHRLVDQNGKHVLVGPGESGYAEGEIEFKWIFFASILPIDQATDIQTTTETEDQQTDIQTTTGQNGDNTDIQTVPTDATGGTETAPPPPTDVKNNTETQTITSTTTVTTVVTPTETTTPGGWFQTPFTGFIAKDGKPWLIAMGVIGAMILILLVLLRKKEKEQKK